MNLSVVAIITAVGWGMLGSPTEPIGQDSAASQEKLIALHALEREQGRSPDEIRATIAMAIGDDDERVQIAALRMLAHRAGGARFAKTAATRTAARTRWAAERASLEPLRATARSKMVSSPSPNVRRAALLALGNLDWVPPQIDGESMSVRLSDDFIDLLVSRYQAEDDTRVRSEIVKTLALDRQAKGAEATLILALHDREPAVLQFAIMGVDEHRLSAGLPMLATLLTHSSASIRTVASGVLGSFGQAAMPYLQTLKLALAAEQDPSVRPTMQGAIESIEKKR